MTKFIPYGRQSIIQSDIDAVSKAMSEEIITRGKHVEAFEEALALYCGSAYAVAFNSGTAALQAAYFAGEVGPEDRLYTTPNSFVSTTGAAMNLGARPVFIDIDPSTGNLSLEQLALNINTPNSRGKNVIAPVHFSGIAVDMNKLDRMINDPDILIVEDAAHAIGSFYPDGSPVGSCQYSQMTIFSFHPVKTITCGEGGAVTTNDPKLYHRLKLWRNNGIERDPAYLQEPATPWYYEVQTLSGNYNVTDMQGALGLSQLNRIDAFISKRRELVKRYRTLLANQAHITLFSTEADDRTAFHLFVVQINFTAFGISRAQVITKLKEQGIGTQVHYIPIYRHPCIQSIVGDIAEYFPMMEQYYAQALSLPLYYTLELEEVDLVVDKLLKVLKGH